MNRAARRAITMVSLMSIGSGCDAIDRARQGSPAESDPRNDLALSLEAPGTMRPGEVAAVRLSIRNGSDSTVAGIIAELVLPAWMEPGVPEPAGTPVTMVASGEGIGLSYPISDPPLQPREQRTIVQPVNVSARSWEGVDISPTRTVRARLTSTDGSPLGPSVQTDVAVAGGLGDPADDVDGDGRRVVSAEGIGPIRLGMTPAEVRREAPAARDTSWTAEGMVERGMVVAVGDAHALAELVDGRVSRIFVRDPRLRTGEGLGVGSRLEELRSEYGRACAGAGEGRVAVWFPEKPGISFMLDIPPRSTLSAEELPGSAEVAELFVRRGTDEC